MTPTQSARPFLSGLLCRCPNCGVGDLYAGFLDLAPACSHCAYPLALADSGDGPAVFVMMIVGFIIVFGLLFTEIAYRPPVWVHLVVWLPLGAALSMALLRPIKGLMIAAQIRNKASQQGPDDLA